MIYASDVNILFDSPPLFDILKSEGFLSVFLPQMIPLNFMRYQSVCLPVRLSICLFVLLAKKVYYIIYIVKRGKEKKYFKYTHLLYAGIKKQAKAKIDKLLKNGRGGPGWSGGERSFS